MPIKILLDAGHYGKRNRSPVVPAYYESVQMWKLHLRLKDALEAYGFTVGVTREKETDDLEVTKRGRMAKGYDLFLSLHSNAADDRSVNRVSVYRAYDNLNNAELLGRQFADTVARVMQVSGGETKTRRGSRGEYYGVMRGARAAGCPLYYIIEHSFHTNEYAANWLLDDDNLERLAQSEADVIRKYYGADDDASLRGDVNGDGKLDATDYFMAKRAVLGTLELTPEEAARADVDGNGVVDAADYFAIKRAVLGTLDLGQDDLT